MTGALHAGDELVSPDPVRLHQPVTGHDGTVTIGSDESPASPLPAQKAEEAIQIQVRTVCCENIIALLCSAFQRLFTKNHFLCIGINPILSL